MPTSLARLFGRGRGPRGDDRAYGLRLAAALLEHDRPLRVLEAACRLALRTGLCDLAVVVAQGEAGPDLLAGRSRTRPWRDLREALASRATPWSDLGDQPHWVHLQDDQFQPGAALLRRLDLRWLDALPLRAPGPAGPRDGLVLLAGHDAGVTAQHPLVLIARLIWMIGRQRLLTAAGLPAAASPWPGGGIWDAAPAPLALVGRQEVLAVNARARELLAESVGRDGRAWYPWLLGAVQRLEVAGLASDVMSASQSRRRSLSVTLGETTDSGARLVALAAAAPGGDDARPDEATLRTLGHELRTPLTAMKTSLDLVLRGDTGPLAPDQARFLGAARRNLDRLNRLLSDLLDAERAEAGQLAVRTAAVDLGDLLRQDLALFEVAAGEKGVTLDLSGMPASYPACVDADKVQQMLHNLVSNAIKYTPREGVVRVSLDDRDDHAPGLGPRLARRFELPLDVFTLVVADSGLGMSDEYVQHLFEPFSRDDRAEVSHVPGAGLGLHITRGLVEAHGGEIRLSSVPGRGTTAWVVLPRDAAAARVITAGRQLAAAASYARGAAWVVLDLRHRLPGLPPTDLAVAGNHVATFLARLAQRQPGCDLPRGEACWALAPGLWVGLAADPERLAPAWEVATSAPESPLVLECTAWETLDLGEAAASPRPETTELTPAG